MENDQLLHLPGLKAPVKGLVIQWLLIFIGSGCGLRAAVPADLKPSAVSFFDKHCLECHDAESEKGGLNLEKIDYAMSGRAQTDLWTRIFDRIENGEMPPAKKVQPTEAERGAILAAVQPALTSADQAGREVVLRRLNRIEYRNTIRELLAVELDFDDLLPEDQQAGGFDNNGETLAVSTEQMQAYLAAARRAITAAIHTGERPKTETFTVDSIREVKPYFADGSYSLVDGRVVIFTSSDNSSYSKISTRDRRIPVRGRYRFRFQAATQDSENNLGFTVSGSSFSGLEATHQNLGYYEVSAEPKTYEIEALLEAKSAIQFFALGLPTYLKKKPGVSYPGVGFGAVEITGPLIEQWPPESHQRLFGTMDVKQGTLADAERILRNFLPRAFRRPADEAEVARFVSLTRTVLESGRSFEESIQAGLIGVLCSPSFLYLREDPLPGTTRITDWELASRLSYFLWSGPPDETLLDLAARKELSQPGVLTTQVERLLGHAKSDEFVKHFTGQWLGLRRLNDTTPDQKLYPKFDELLQVSLLWESEGYFREMLKGDLPITDFLDARWAMLNQRLAEHYGIPGVKGLELRKVSLPADSVRGGVLTQAAVLKVTANGTTTSPVLRGAWVLENILGLSTPPPPPNTAGIEPDIRGAETVREQLDKHRTAESCNVCHRKIDPPGFALESFDPVGAYREHYLRWNVTNVEHNWGGVVKGAPVDSSGVTANGETFADIRDLKKWLLASSDHFSECLTEKLFSYALGREMGFSDRAAIDEIAAQTRARGDGLRSLIHAIIQSETFSTR
jgi:hypothetical protein